MAATAKTIAAVFVCSDGAVLCADTQLTYPDFFTHPESKIVVSTENRERAFFAYAGDVDFSKMCIGMLSRRLLANETGPDALPRYEVLEEEAIEIHRTYHGLYENGERDLDLELLVVIQTEASDGQPGLLSIRKITGPIVSPIDDYECIGSGMAVARGVLAPLYTPRMNVNQAAFAAAYALGEAKKHADGCGGKSQIVKIFRAGSDRAPRDFLVMPYDHTELLENSYRTTQDKLGRLVARERYLGLAKDPEFESDLKALVEAVRDGFKKRTVLGVPPAPTQSA